MKMTIILFTMLISATCNANPPLVNLVGKWKSLGGGWILSIDEEGNYIKYDTTTTSCLLNTKGELTDYDSNIRISDSDLIVKEGIADYFYKRINILPEQCLIQLTEENRNDPLFNFEVFANTVEEHYAFFELNNINWSSLRDKQRKKLSEESTSLDLYKVIDETLTLVNDNHGFLAADQLTEALFDSEMEKESLQGDPPASKEYGDFEVANLVSKHHITERMTSETAIVEWGKVDDNTGYLLIKSMWLYADLMIEKARIDNIGYINAYVESRHNLNEADYISKEVQGVRRVMKRVIADLAEVEKLVVDLRFNGGGQDAVSLEILSWLTRETGPIAIRKLRDGHAFSPQQIIGLEPKDDAFGGELYVLTSSQTGSAAEFFALATLSVNNAINMGTPTQGALSTSLQKRLPNDWSFAISNEIYSDLEGNFFENIGVPVDRKFDYEHRRQLFFKQVVKDLDADWLKIQRGMHKLNDSNSNPRDL